jgi:hypothetical protein
MSETWKENYAVYNPHNYSIDELPVIFGFNNGGCYGFMSAVLIAQDGEVLGTHTCSSEGFMRGDLGILKGARPDRHTVFRKHYPDGYKMDFVSYSDIDDNKELTKALKIRKRETDK